MGTSDASNDAMQARISDLEQLHAVDQELIAVLEAESSVEREQIANLKIALATARRIGAAIGVLMARRQMSDTEAIEVLRRASQDTHRKLRDIAEDVLVIGDLPPDPR